MRIKPRKVPVAHPGVLLQELLDQHGVTQSELARHLRTSHAYVNDVCRGRRGIGLQFAIKLAKAFRQNPQFWLGMQVAWDVEHAKDVEVAPLKLRA